MLRAGSTYSQRCSGKPPSRFYRWPRFCVLSGSPAAAGRRLSNCEAVMAWEINCDMGEAYGLYEMGDDEGIMPFITVANVACGFHAPA